MTPPICSLDKEVKQMFNKLTSSAGGEVRARLADAQRSYKSRSRGPMQDIKAARDKLAAHLAEELDVQGLREVYAQLSPERVGLVAQLIPWATCEAIKEDVFAWIRRGDDPLTLWLMQFDGRTVELRLTDERRPDHIASLTLCDSPKRVIHDRAHEVSKQALDALRSADRLLE
ncbi:hypothetical protein JYT15_00625 [Acidimicrobium ferrooxidans]|nr:hypothetical protein [Acidimicrobium ferrooxidans]